MQQFQLSDYRHSIAINVRFMDIDALQHVNNARYLNFLEEARIAYSQDLLNIYHKIEDLNMLVARVEIDFIRPIKFEDTVKIYTRISKLGTKSFQFDSIITSKKESGIEETCARGIQTLVAFDIKKGISVPVTNELRTQIELIEPKLNQ